MANQQDPHLAALMSATVQEHVAPGDVALNAAAVERRLGYGRPNGQHIAAHVRETVAEALTRAAELIEPRGIWHAFGIASMTAAELQLENGSMLHMGGIVGSQMRMAQAVAVFVVTIGPRVEQAGRALIASGRALDGYVLDVVGSAAVEACADVVERRIAAASAKCGWKNTNRFSPGYCTWETAGQNELFALLPPEPAGVHLTDSALMRPLKSVSGIIGLGPDVAYRPYPCEICGIEYCSHRLADSRET